MQSEATAAHEEQSETQEMLQSARAMEPEAEAMRQVQLGHGFRADLLRPITDTEPVGIVLWHRSPKTESACGCRLLLEPGDIVSTEPLTLRPTITCKFCGVSGRITGGQWEPA